MNKKIKNIELVTIALYESGGTSKCVDTEDRAVKADQIDDQRFKWRKQKYKEFIDRGLVVESLNAARVRKIGSFLEGSDNKGWILTSVGLEFCKKTKNKFNGHTIRKKRLSKVEKNYLTREQFRIENSEAFVKYSKGEIKKINEIDLKNLFKIDDYTSKIDLEKRILHLLDNFKEKDRIFELINIFKKEVTKYVTK